MLDGDLCRIVLPTSSAHLRHHLPRKKGVRCIIGVGLFWGPLTAGNDGTGWTRLSCTAVKAGKSVSNARQKILTARWFTRGRRLLLLIRVDVARENRWIPRRRKVKCPHSH